MSSIQDATIKGLNDFIREQREVPGDGCWSLVQFDDQYEVVYSQRDQHDVPLLTPRTFQPRGSTALIDAVCRTIDDTGRRLAATPEDERPSKVLMVIMTDGYENASHEFMTRDLNARVSHQRDKYSWQFLYLGANQDAIAEAAKYGIAKGAAMTYQATVQGTQSAFRAANRGTRRWKVDGNNTAEELLTDPADQKEVQVNVTIKK
jgi:hypothetical protein